MSWRSSGATNAELISNLLKNGIITSPRVYQAMVEVDRANYCNRYPYDDAPQTIGYGVTISAPHMHAYALDTVVNHLVDGARVLDVGSGSGYLTACIGNLIRPRGKAIGIDHIPELVELATKNVMKDEPELIKSGVVEFVCGDGRQGYPSGAPYDVIHVGAAVGGSMEPFLQQLKPGGIIFVPEGQPYMAQVIKVYRKDSNGRVTSEPLMPVQYVPLTSREDQIGLR